MINLLKDNKKVLYEKISLEDKIPIKLLYVDFKKNLHRVISKHWHRSVEIILPLYNGTNVWIEGREIEVNSGDILIINSKDIHACRSINSQDDYRGYALQLSYDYCKDIYKEFDNIYFSNTYEAKSKKEIVDCISLIIELYNEGEESNRLIISGYCQILLGLLLKYQGKMKNNNNEILSEKRKDLIVSILIYLEENYNEYFDTDKLSKHFNMSYGYLCKVFKESLQITMSEYVNNIRLQASVRDMIYTDLPILTIALNHGFPNIKSFNKCFKAQYSKTPKQYRNLYRGE